MGDGGSVRSQATIPAFQRAFEEGTLTSERLVQLYLDRIEAYDQQGPNVNAVITLNPDWRAAARELDEERRQSGARSLLHGVPVVLKDTIDVKGMPTTGGFTLLKGSYPARDAAVTRKLKEAGALVLAKVNANDWFGNAPMSASTLGGQTRNPHNLGYTSGGSSCGTAAAVAANFAPLGIGTDTSGSVLMPAAHSGLFGMIPSRGLISRAGLMAGWPTLGRVGAMARSAFDLAATLSCLIGWDPEDQTTNESLEFFPRERYEAQLSGRSLGAFRVGVLREMWREEPGRAEASRIVDAQLQLLRREGTIVVDPVLTGIDLDELGSLESPANVATLYELLPSLEAYFARLGPDAPFTSVFDLIETAGFEQLKSRFRIASTLPPPEQSDHYRARLRSQAMLRNAVVETIRRFDLDAVVLPYSLDGPSRIGGPVGRTNSLASHAGLPSVVAPAGRTNESLPIGIQFIAEPYRDATLLQLAHLLEQATGGGDLPASTPALPGEELPAGEKA